MTDISKHPLLKACHEACIAIEKLGCGPDQTDAVSRVSDMMRPIEALVAERDEALTKLRAITAELEETKAENKALKADIQAEIDGALDYRSKNGAHPHETITMFMDRIASERDEARSQLADSLAENERVYRMLTKQQEGENSAGVEARFQRVKAMKVQRISDLSSQLREAQEKISHLEAELRGGK